MDGLRRAELGSARMLKLAGVAAGSLAVVAAATCGGLYLWLRSYAPLGTLPTGFAPGPGVGAAIQPAAGSGGKEVYFPAYRHGKTFDAAFTLRDDGRFAVTVTGIVAEPEGAPPWIGPVDLLATDSRSASADPARTHPFHEVRLSPGSTAVLVARFQPVCPKGHGRSADVFTDRLRLRYRYLRVFERTQTVVLPFAVTLRCIGGPPATP